MPPPACHNAARSWGVQPDYGGGVGTGVNDFGGGAGGGDDGGWRGRASNAARVSGLKTMPAATDVGGEYPLQDPQRRGEAWMYEGEERLCNGMVVLVREGGAEFKGDGKGARKHREPFKEWESHEHVREELSAVHAGKRGVIEEVSEFLWGESGDE